MKLAILIAILALPLAAQVTPPSAPAGTVVATALGKPVTLTFQVWNPPAPLPAACDTLNLLIGESANCRYNISGPAPKDISVAMAYGSCVSGPSTITVSAGQTSAPFTVTGVCITSVLAAPQAQYNLAPDTAPRYSAELRLAECAR